MLKLQPNPVFEWPVAIVAPGGERHVFTGVFRHKGRAEMQAFLGSAQTMPDIDSVMEILTGWRDVDGEFNRGNVATLIDAYPAAAASLFEAWIKGLTGAAEKN